MTASLRDGGIAPWRDPHATQSLSLVGAVRSMSSNRRLIMQLLKREIASRYKGSALGFYWTFLVPMFMLAVYTFVFSEVFKARWDVGVANESKGSFAIILFVGTIVLGFFNEVLNRSPLSIVAHANFVKKVVFPLEALPVVTVLVAGINSIASSGVLFLAFLFLNGFLHWTALLMPIVFVPLLVLSLGVAWGLSALGVYLRGIPQLTSLVAAVLMFLSPVFYPVSAVPPAFQKVLMLNPLTFVIEQARRTVIAGLMPDWLGLLAYSVGALIVAGCGFVVFQKTRKGFADVL